MTGLPAPALRTSNVLAVVGFALTAGAATATTLVMTRSDYATWAPLLIGPVLIGLSLPVLRRVAGQEQGRALFGLLVAALLVKFLGAMIRWYMAFDVYGGSADAATYHRTGSAIAESFRSGVFQTGLTSLTGTDFIHFLTGIIYTVSGSTLFGGFLIFSWLSFWGQVLFYVAFRTAVPDGRRRLYAVLVFFLPTLFFWPSSIGKEAWMIFTLGMAAYGAAFMFERGLVPGVLVTGLGLGLAGLARPHVAALMGLALALATLVREQRGSSAMRRLGTIVLVATVAGVLLTRSQQFLSDALGSDVSSGALERTADRTGGGGSGFEATVVRGPADLPMAAFTVLFRPHLLEVHNAQAAIAGLETTGLAVLAAVGLHRGARALRQLRSRPYVALAFTYTGGFIVAFSSISNFGILTRQRAQLLPLFAVLLALPRRTRTVGSST